MSKPTLSHIDEKGQVRMVDISAKDTTSRIAIASACVRMRPETLAAILTGDAPKGDVLAAARIAGIMAAKRTHELIPLCHPLAISSVNVEFAPDEKNSQIEIQATVRVMGKTGVEMEALVAASIAALTIYDMCKAIDREMMITEVGLTEKTGGKSGPFRRERS
ncbi:MAG: cyclic pyranopterin monophosphate synthase MoaC [Aestuariivirgaceae bacterium]